MVNLAKIFYLQLFTIIATFCLFEAYIVLLLHVICVLHMTWTLSYSKFSFLFKKAMVIISRDVNFSMKIE